MWEWTLNWDEITPNIIIGSCPMTVSDVDLIVEETGCTAILCLQTDIDFDTFGIKWDRIVDRCKELGVVIVRSPLRDFDKEHQSRNLPNAVRELAKLISENHRVYVHCTAGINRSPLTVLGYMVFIQQMPVESALQIIQEKRPGASPYMDAFYNCKF